jgi:HPr kinase/phosphorylase
MMIKAEKGVPVQSLLEQGDLEICQHFNDKWLDNLILHPRPQKSGLSLAGYLKSIEKDRVQVFGNTELGYLAQLDESKRETRLKNFLALKPPVILISQKQTCPEILLTLSSKNKTPLLVSELRTSLLISRISAILYRHFSRKIKINGVLMNIMGLGTLITGESGIGKSETALELINQGHQLVSDDLIEFYLDPNDEPVGRSLERIKQWLEVRGLGIINIIDLFGVGALLEEIKLDLVINLERWDRKKKYDRLGEDNLYFKILGKEIPMYRLPVALGRNLATLIEVTVKYYISRRNGSKTFIEHIYGEEENG